MPEFGTYIGGLLLDLAVYTVNGYLLMAYAFFDGLPVLLSLACAALVARVFDRQAQLRAAIMPQRIHGPHAAGAPRHNHQILTALIATLWVAAQALYPNPVPWLGAAMWGLTLAGLVLLPAERTAMLWRGKTFVLSYALALIGFRLYLLVAGSASPQEWARLLGTVGEAERVIAGNMGLITTMGAWATWFLLPFAHAFYLVQRLLVHPMSLMDPRATAGEIVAAIRARGD